MNKRLKALLVLFIVLAITAGFTFIGIDGAKDIKLGLDLSGGVSITYQTDKEKPTETEMKDTIYKLQLKAQDYSTEAQVYQEGDNRINIDIPAVYDANKILKELGEPGTLEFTDEEGNVLLTGADVKNAQAGRYDSKQGATENIISLEFNDEGAEKFAKATEDNLGKPIFIVYNGKVISYPRVQSVITGGKAQISPIETYEEADKIASTIRIGALPIKLEQLRSNVVGASLGEEAISTSIKAGTIGVALVMLFLCVVYLLPGLAASLALVLYVGLELMLLQAFEVTLTLPGIAGIILSIGMAVDANVIIFTRMKEEIAEGKNVENAMKAGYSKALSAILDGNITTLIAAAVLYLRGSGTVKGFATTLALGIVISLFTALIVTRRILWCFYTLGAENPKFYGKKKDTKIFDFIGFRKKAYAISIAVIAVGFICMGVNKAKLGNLFNYDLDFEGGSSTNITFNDNMDREALYDSVVPIFEDVIKDGSAVIPTEVKGSNEAIIKTRTLTTDERIELYDEIMNKFNVGEDRIITENISAAVSNEMKKDAVFALAIAIFFMLLYIWFRFKNIKFASASVLALCHDVFVTITFYALLKWAVGSSFIACVLTIVGYSINATIVIFDRIRENLNRPGGKRDVKLAVNEAISQTLTRSINTSLTTFITIFILFLLGVPSIRNFTLPLMVGIVSGAYSSVFIAGPLWYDLNERKNKKK